MMPFHAIRSMAMGLVHRNWIGDFSGPPRFAWTISSLVQIFAPRRCLFGRCAQTTSTITTESSLWSSSGCRTRSLSQRETPKICRRHHIWKTSVLSKVHVSDCVPSKCIPGLQYIFTLFLYPSFILISGKNGSITMPHEKVSHCVVRKSVWYTGILTILHQRGLIFVLRTHRPSCIQSDCY